MDDREVIQCNYTEGVSSIPEGARAYVINPNPGGGGDRIEVLARSRSGRWIHKWENVTRLGNFRAKILPPEHPIYKQAEYFPTPARAEWLMNRG